MLHPYLMIKYYEELIKLDPEFLKKAFELKKKLSEMEKKQHELMIEHITIEADFFEGHIGPRPTPFWNAQQVGEYIDKKTRLLTNLPEKQMQKQPNETDTQFAKRMKELKKQKILPKQLQEIIKKKDKLHIRYMKKLEEFHKLVRQHKKKGSTYKTITYEKATPELLSMALKAQKQRKGRRK